MPKVIIDGIEVEYSGQPNLIELAKTKAINIPFFCYHKALSVSGNCRMCLVEVGMPVRNRETGAIEKDENGNDKIGFMPKLQPACYQQLADGMVIKTNTDKVLSARKGVMEFLLANHPLDCPVCDQAGECVLQDYAFDHGDSRSRFTEEKRTFTKEAFSDVITPELNRCIHCDRCSRFTKEVVGDYAFTRTWRGNSTKLSALPGAKITHNYQGNMVDLCPVGALTLTDFRFKSRVWFLRQGDTICGSCGKGCNVTADIDKNGKILRFKPRFNEQVNSYWMCDYGRLNYKHLNENRANTYLVQGKKSSAEETFNTLNTLAAKGKIGVVASAAESNENLQELAEFINKTLKTENVDYRISQAQIEGSKKVQTGEILLVEDPFANSEGAAKAGLSPKSGGMGAIDMMKNHSKLDLLVVIASQQLLNNNDLIEQLAQAKNLVLFTPFETSLSSNAAATIPIASYTEQNGTYTNIDGVEQKGLKLTEAPAGVYPLAEVLKNIRSAVQQ